jgi:hypothetical protein
MAENYEVVVDLFIEKLEGFLFSLTGEKRVNLYTIGILNKDWNEDFVYGLPDIVIED